MKWPTYRTPPVRCPGCARVNDAATGIDHGDAPRPGNLGICIRCASLVIYYDDGGRLGLRLATEAERAEALKDPQVVKVLGAILIEAALDSIA